MGFEPTIQKICMSIFKIDAINLSATHYKNNYLFIFLFLLNNNLLNHLSSLYIKSINKRLIKILKKLIKIIQIINKTKLLSLLIIIFKVST